MNVTGCDAERSQFYLEAAGWELHSALSSFYDGDDNNDSNDDSLVQVASTNEVSSGRQKSETASKIDKFSASSSRMKTVASLQRDEEESSDSSDDEGQAFYAGGSETSGQQILGPSKKRGGADKITQKIFDAARRHGAEPVEQESGSKPTQRQAFVGAGYRLGTDVLASEQVTPSLQGDSSETSQPISVQLKFWSNGFSLDEGPLRFFDDPLNRAFLNSVEKGEIPSELRQAARGSEVHVNIEDHRQEEFVKPALKVAAFSGKGQMLGSPVPHVVRDRSSQPPQASSAPPPELHIDESQPVTTLQIRLSDGTRLISKFNHSHTVANIRQMIKQSRPGSDNNFVLMTTFPNRELTDETKTLQEANLLNAVIVQRKI